jgi:HlyD family secretion protein
MPGAMVKTDKSSAEEILEYQPDAVEIEEKPVAGKVRWVLYLILATLIALVVGAFVFHVDRIIIAEGRLITTSPTMVVQPLNAAVIRSIDIQVGDIVKEGQILATLDSTFTSADLNRLERQRQTLSVQLRRIKAELNNTSFTALGEEGEDGRLQEHLFRQRKIVLERRKQMSDDKRAALNAQRALNQVKRNGLEKEQKLLRDVEGTTAKMSQTGSEHRLRLLETQKARVQASNEIENLAAEEQVLIYQLRQVESEWRQFLEERTSQLMEEEVGLYSELEKLNEEINKAIRLQELVSLRAPRQGIVLNIAERSVGSILQQAEQFITLVPLDSIIEVEAKVQSRDIARIRVGDQVRVKLDAFPFQRHDTLSGEVRIISEDSFQHNSGPQVDPRISGQDPGAAFYRTRIRLLSTHLRNVPQGFRLMPGMKVRAEIKVGKRRIISYFLYPIIRALDESLREP